MATKADLFIVYSNSLRNKKRKQNEDMSNDNVYELQQTRLIVRDPRDEDGVKKDEEEEEEIVNELPGTPAGGEDQQSQLLDNGKILKPYCCCFG